MTNAIRQFFLQLPAKLKEEDKGKHMTWSFWLTLAALSAMPAATALLIVLLIGLAKECWDFRFGSGFCVFDMAGNIIGIAAGQLAWQIGRLVLSP
ncbi:MAG TPA: hypothetical protein DCL01_08475 [Thauera sp.]|nr:hypothetical protein [Thauera sp.]HHW63437.1 hypothetical protein [Rhodocyclaceae bacterium]